MIDIEWDRFLAAVRGGHTDEVASILARQPELASIRRPGRDGPLTAAAKRNQEWCLRVLLPHFTQDPAVVVDAFLGAAEFGSLNCLLSLSIGNHARSRARDGSTALMLAATKGHPECVRALLPHSEPLASNDDGWTPLMMAAFAQHPACVEALLPHSDASAVGARGESALSLALGLAGPKPAARLDTCIDLLAPFAEADLARKALDRLGPARMPRFAALRESEELAFSIGIAPRLNSRGARATEQAQPGLPARCYAAGAHDDSGNKVARARATVRL